MFIGGVKPKNKLLIAFFMQYRGGLSAFKKQILFACCSPVRSGVALFRAFFGLQPGTKKTAPNRRFLLPFS
jgi:hypothetical protein